jgi:hypothetical protein
MLNDNLFYPLGNITHRSNLFIFQMGLDRRCDRSRRGTAVMQRRVLSRGHCRFRTLKPPSPAEGSGTILQNR